MAGANVCLWNIGEWDLKKEIRTKKNEKTNMALVIRLSDNEIHAEIVDMLPDTLFHVYPRKRGDKIWFEINVGQEEGLHPKKPKKG